MSDFAVRIPVVTSYDYVQDTEPTDPDVGEAWWDTVNSVGSVWTGSSWDEESAPQPGVALELVDGAYNLLVGDALTTDVNGNLTVASNSIGTSLLSFDPATQSELDSHAGDTTNPHSVTDDQTGAATALSSHAGDPAAHHAAPTTLASGTASNPGSSNISWGVISEYVGNDSELSPVVQLYDSGGDSAIARIYEGPTGGTLDPLTVQIGYDPANTQIHYEVIRL